MNLPLHRAIGLILAVIGLIALALLLPDSLHGTGTAPLRVLLGWSASPFVLVAVLGGVMMLFADKLGWQVRWQAIAAAEVIFLVLLTITHLGLADPLTVARAGGGGGLIGWALSQALTVVLPRPLAWAVLVAVGLGAGWFFWRDLPPTWTRRPTLWLHRAVAGLTSVAHRLAGRSTRTVSPQTPRATRPDRPAAVSASERLSRWAAAAAGTLRAIGASLLPSPPTAPEETPQSRATNQGREKPASKPVARSVARPAPPAAQTPAAADAGPRDRPTAEPSTRDTAKGVGRPSRLKTRPDNLPPLDLLRAETHRANSQADARQRAQILKQTLAEFGVPVEIVSIKEGPTVTQFGLEPGEIVRELRDGEIVRRRVSVHKIQRLSNDLALALAAASIRIEAPVPGRPYVGIEIPNPAKTTVTLRGLLESAEFARVRSPLAIALGRDVAGDPVIADLARLPHLLIAGATGSGKSVCINAIVSALLMNNGPERVRFLMVDPKMVELPTYNGIPHLYGNVITDVAQVPAALAWLTLQMDDRYRLFAARGARNIEEYNHKLGRSKSAEPLPYIVLVIDELADLMMTAAYDVERQICRLAQMSRATGIHLVLATQRPSVDVITGLIKANFPARIAFAVTSQIDSRVILDTPGAERLLGRGDMLYMAPDSARLVRIQGCFVSDEEIDGIVSFWRGGRDADDPPPADEADVPWAGMIMAADDEKDELLTRALELLQGKRQVSTSLLQRQLRIGYPRAARLMEQLEEMGAVGPDEGGGRSREVLVDG